MPVFITVLLLPDLLSSSNAIKVTQKTGVNVNSLGGYLMLRSKQLDTKLNISLSLFEA